MSAATRPPLGLRAQIHWIVGAVTLLFVAVLIAQQLATTRESIKEEVVAANRVAGQLLTRTGWLYAAQGTPGMVAYLQGLGRVRANDIQLLDAQGRQLYRSPPSPYKAGRDAPAWFAALVSPPPDVQTVQFPDGRLEIRADASRAVLDAWDALAWLAGLALALLLAVQAAVAWVVGRTLRPFGQIEQALGALQAGRLDVQLPPLAGREAAAIGAAFNRMVGALQQHIATEARAVRAEGQLSDQRELQHWLEHRLDQERRTIARELHDELGQSVTAMRSMALSLAQRSQGSEAQAARLIADECARLYDAMHGLIPRLAPLVLDALGLADALADLAERTRAAHAGVQLELALDVSGLRLSPDAALTLYRSAQEGITNALRHGAARALRLQVGPQGAGVALALDDDGQGLPAGAVPAEARAHHGLRWLRERADALGGTLALGPRPDGAGLRLAVWLPLPAAGSAVGAPALPQPGEVAA